MYGQLMLRLLVLSLVILLNSPVSGNTTLASGPLLFVVDVLPGKVEPVQVEKDGSKAAEMDQGSTVVKRKAKCKKKAGKLLLGITSLGFLGFIARKNQKGKYLKRQKAEAPQDGAVGGIFLTLLLLAGLIWLFVSIGFTVKMVLTILGIAILVLGVIIGIIALAWSLLD